MYFQKHIDVVVCTYVVILIRDFTNVLNSHLFLTIHKIYFLTLKHNNLILEDSETCHCISILTSYC